MKIQKIALSGNYGVGKTTYGNRLAEAGFYHTTFAKKLRLQALTVAPQEWHKDIMKSGNKPQYIREFLCQVSRAHKDKYGEDYYARIADNIFNCNVVISDLRFKVELDSVIASGFKIWWIGEEPDDNYDLKLIYANVDKFLPRYPSISTFMAGLGPK